MGEFTPSIPGYEILGELGRGGMGIVYKAQSLRYDRPVALKMILSGRGANLLELARFRIEAEAIGSLEHPNIVLIHEVGVHLGYPFFVLEYAPGGSLAGRIRSQPVPCDWAAQVCMRLALAMQHAHERGIIHRDLKPANVLLMADDVPKVTDFGLGRFTTGGEGASERRDDVTVSIPEAFYRLTEMQRTFERTRASSADDAGTTFEDHVVRTQWNQTFGTLDSRDQKRLDSAKQFVKEAVRQACCELSEESRIMERLTSPRAVMGTLRYMAPEQAWGRIDEVGPPADIYSLGAVMYVMLTGRPPFTGDSARLIEEVRSRIPVPPRQWRDSIAPSLEAICMRCLEKKIERRYESMGSLADDLRRSMSGEDVRALHDEPTGGKTDETAGGVDNSATTKTWVPSGSTQPASTRRRKWWQFWT